MDEIIVSPLAADPSSVPLVPLIDYIIPAVREKAAKFGEKVWVEDVNAGTKVQFCEVEDQSRRIASALNKRGFRRNDVLYFVTYEMAHLNVVHLAVWRLGGAVRGSFQSEAPAEYVRQLRETRSRFVMIDSDTAPILREAVSEVDWQVEFISVGNNRVSGATSFAELIEDCGRDCPTRVEINPQEDAVFIPSTSGSTGVPKGAVHTHYSVVSLLHSIRGTNSTSSSMTLANNYAVANFTMMISSLFTGSTLYLIGKFRREELFRHLLKYKPNGMMLYPYVASWFCRTPEIEENDLSFLQFIMLGGSVLDPATLTLLETRLPKVLFFQVYGITECIAVSNSFIGYNFNGKSIKVIENQGELCTSSGKLGSYVQAKIRDRDSGMIMGRYERGEILIRAPHLMAGYLRGINQEHDRSDIDQEGWFYTGDLGFFDDEGNVYVKERFSFIFKYYMQFVSPSEIECVLQEHEAVQSAGVVGIPHPETTNVARGFIVLRPGSSATCQQLQDHVAQRLPEYLHLHGGVRFLPVLPMNRGGKLDRLALMKFALVEGESR